LLPVYKQFNPITDDPAAESLSDFNGDVLDDREGVEACVYNGRTMVEALPG
jgi:hypothetical protein